MTDEVLIWDKAPVIHELAPENKPENEDKEEKDMTDSQLMRFDVVKVSIALLTLVLHV